MRREGHCECRDDQEQPEEPDARPPRWRCEVRTTAGPLVTRNVCTISSNPNMDHARVTSKDNAEARPLPSARSGCHVVTQRVGCLRHFVQLACGRPKRLQQRVFATPKGHATSAAANPPLCSRREQPAGLVTDGDNRFRRLVQHGRIVRKCPSSGALGRRKTMPQLDSKKRQLATASPRAGRSTSTEVCSPR